VYTGYNRPTRTTRLSKTSCYLFVYLFCYLSLLVKQEAFEKCWAHSPQRAASPDVASGTVARRLRIDVHDIDIDNDDDNDNA